MKVVIRKAKIEDARAIHEAHMKSILEVCGPDYTSEQLEVWGRRPFNEERRQKVIQNDHVWVVDVDGVIEGYCHFAFMWRDHEYFGQLYALYITPKVLKKGVGKKLFDLVVEKCREANVHRFEFGSTITAREFYRKMGCRDLPCSGYFTFDNVNVPAFTMEYWVESAPPQIRIEKPSIKYGASWLEALKEYHAENRYVEITSENSAQYIEDWANSETHVKPGRVPDTYLWAIENDRYVGRISLRHALNLFLEKFGGHIGYEVLPSARGRGIATEMLRQLLFFPKAKEIRSLLLTADEDNISSHNVMIKNGALRTPGFYRGDNEVKSKIHFWINTTQYPRIETPRLVLSRFRQSDTDAVFEYASSPGVARSVTWDAYKSNEDVYNFFYLQQTRSLATSDKSFYIFAIREKATGRAIGSFQFSRTGIVGQIDYALHEKYWNQGLMSEAAKHMIRWAFDRYPDLKRIQSSHLPDNVASGRVMQKAGMQCEGVRRQCMMVKGRCCDLVQFAIIRGDHIPLH